MIDKVRAIKRLELSRKDEVRAFLSVFYPNMTNEKINEILRGVI